MDLHYMDQRLRSLVIFRELLMDPVIAGFEAVLAMADEDDGDAFATACAEFESSLFESTESWTDYLCNAVLQSENVCVRRKAHAQRAGRADAGGNSGGYGKCPRLFCRLDHPPL